jgi:hypothetical protein
MFSCAPLRDRLPRSLRWCSLGTSPSRLRTNSLARTASLYPALRPFSSASLYYKSALYTYALPLYYLSASFCVPFAPSASSFVCRPTAAVSPARHFVRRRAGGPRPDPDADRGRAQGALPCAAPPVAASPCAAIFSSSDNAARPFSSASVRAQGPPVQQMTIHV